MGSGTSMERASQIRQWLNGTTECEFGTASQRVSTRQLLAQLLAPDRPHMGIVRRADGKGERQWADGEGERDGRKRNGEGPMAKASAMGPMAEGERDGEGAKAEERDGDGEVPSAECFPRPPSEVYYRRAVEGPIPGWKTVIGTGKKPPRTTGKKRRATGRSGREQRRAKGKKPNREQEAGNG